jgi:Domain of unknown function (DUF4253)
MSSMPPRAGVWASLHAVHATIGVWPLLLDSDDRISAAEEFRPWGSGELYPDSVTSPDRHAAADLLAGWWERYAGEPATVGITEAPVRDPDVFPPVAARPTAVRSAVVADRLADTFLQHHPHARLGLVAADSGAHALSAVGWQGPVNYDNDTGKFAAVVASWQQRFGARTVGVGGGELHLSVAAPPDNDADALAVACEHFAFCPDNVWQGARPCTVTAYAKRLIGADAWTFWWD